MGCFATCFGTCKPDRRRRRRRSLKTHPSLLEQLQKNQSIEDFKVEQLVEDEQQQDEEIDNSENPTDFSSETRLSSDKKKEKANLSGRKKVTFDLNVQVYENSSRDEDEDDADDEEEKELIEEERVDVEERKAKASCEGQCRSDSSCSSLFSYPPNHRYQNCRDSDDDFDEILSSDESEIDGFTDDESDDDDYGEVVESGVKSEVLEVGKDKSSETLFSLSVDSKKQNLRTGGSEKEVNSPMTVTNVPEIDSNFDNNGSKYVDSVLNPIENLSQWKVIKAKSRLASKDQAKENENSVADFEFPVKKDALQKEIAVDTSLSTWLVGSERGSIKRSDSRNSSVSVRNAPVDRKLISPNKFEDRPILGALTLEEIRQMSAASTPRKSPSRSPDDIPIIGSVGSYWSHTGQATNSGSSTKSTKSRYRESAEVVWDSTPFETRLEKALEKEANCEEVLAV